MVSCTCRKTIAIPDSDNVKFPVVVLSKGGNDSEAIVVLGGGGPGNSLGLDTNGMYYHWEVFWDQFVSQGHEVILMEQRGVGDAVPNTTCFEVVSDNERVFRTAPDEMKEWQSYTAAMQACRQRLSAGGVDLSNYDTVQSAADVEALRVGPRLRPLGALRRILWRPVSLRSDASLSGRGAGGHSRFTLDPGTLLLPR